MYPSLRGSITALVVVVSVLVGIGAPTSSVTAATTSSGEKCPTAAALYTATPYPFPPSSTGTSTTDLVGCTGSYSAPAPAPGNSLAFTFGDIATDDGCSTVTSLSATTTGTPGGDGWAFYAYDAVTSTLIPLTTGQTGAFVAWGSAAGAQSPLVAYTFLSPSAQPASGSYSVTASLDPTGISLAHLAAGGLKVVVIALTTKNPGGGLPTDVLTTVTANVTLDNSACTSTSTTTADPGTNGGGNSGAAETGIAPSFTG